ncbi:DUF1788 domain-containing protein [Desulfobotulus mexicanus]|uniref:DUF1788 domain-containing protein n=2 Tax=Desulfobotulus mexicanus TaxID=2586642 RepID=A0A5Q4VHE3_9BACT|nr:DUF1788 domain-containing protein [Desulfobotulus mexicanus]
MPIKDRFEFLVSVISGQRFLQKQGIGNEVPFFICPFRPEEATDMERLIKNLIRQLEKSDIKVLHINLYDLSIDLLKEREIWQQIMEVENEVSKEELMELLRGVLDPEHHFVPAIAARMEEADFDLLFLSGIGEVFPYIRSHHLLNNLQSKAKEKPTLMFFPGTYSHCLESGSSLELFGKLRDDNYYRAFNIYHCQS